MEKENRRGGQEEIWKGKQEKAKQEKEKTNKEEEIKERWQQVCSVKKISGVEFYSFNFLQIGIAFCQNS